MTIIRFVLGDQLTRGISSLVDLNPAEDVVLMIEAAEETTYVPHHKQKIALILSAMRHFAADLRAEGITVDYVALDAPDNTGSFTRELLRAARRHHADRIVVTEAGEWRVRSAMDTWSTLTGLDVDIRDDDRFFADHARFARWALGRKSFRMEFFYREMRRETGFLMDGGEPAGGIWNFDSENRGALPKGQATPPRIQFKPDTITSAVLDLVVDRFDGHFGELGEFHWACTRHDALRALEDFIATALPLFGDYQDAMKSGAPFLWHAVISPYLNIGLLTPREVCVRAEAAWRAGHAPLNAVEGFIRQILGWREYVRGIYWLSMPDYARQNVLGGSHRLPDFYWTGDTDMNCLKQAIGDTRRFAYSHHIQRLMVTGNFALLLGVSPVEISTWYRAVYADAFEWVEMPNTLGMSQFADGGLLASKPYAASGAYINRMSDFCGKCRFDVRAKTGPDACPFNYLYWAFFIRNEDVLKGNPRLGMPYRQIANMTPARRREIMSDTEQFTASIK